MDNNNPGQNNPYAPPSANVDEGDQGFDHAANFIPEGQIIPIGMIPGLFSEAWGIFRNQPGQWIGCGLLFLLICGLCGCIPIGGQIIGALMLGGFMITCARARDTGVVEFGDLFAGFQTHGSPLAIFGLIQAGFYYVIYGPFAISQLVLTFTSAHDHSLLVIVKILALIAQAVGAFILGLSNFAGPSLIVFHGFKPFDAFKASLSAWFKNWGFGLLFGLLALLILAAGVIACCLGFLVAFPISAIANYLVYRAIFLADNRATISD